MSANQAATPRTPLKLLLDGLGSYGLSCTLLLLLFLLTYVGTLEQVDHGLYEVQKKYFESWFLVHELNEHISIPLPGALLVQILLAANLVVGGLVRIRKSPATYGIIVTHLGILLLLLAGVVKLELAEEGHLTLYERDRSNEYVSYHEWEVAIYDADARQEVREWLIPGEEFLHLGTQGRVFTHEKLPFQLELRGCLTNCQPGRALGAAAQPVVNGLVLRELPPEKESERNMAGVVATVSPREGEPQQGLLWALQSAPWVVSAGGRRWALDLRRKRFSLPFTIVLDEFTRELHPGTNMPSMFMSEVTKLEDGSREQIEISMNEPLRTGGYVLFQASWGPANARPGDPLFSTFAVVRNPSDYWPLYACIIIAIGLTWAFGVKLAGYVASQAPKREAS